jgi:hypothetical protein
MFVGVVLITTKSQSFEIGNDQIIIATDPSSLEELLLPSTNTLQIPNASLPISCYGSYSPIRSSRLHSRGSSNDALQNILGAVGTHRVRRMELDYFADIASPERNISPSRRT